MPPKVVYGKLREADITQELLRRIFDYNPETGTLTKIKYVNGNKRGPYEGRARAGAPATNGSRHVRATIGENNFLAHRLIWIWWHGRAPNGKLDHINRVRDDNRIANLREASDFENAHNKSLHKRNRSGVTGVRWIPEIQKWEARIMANRKRHLLGTTSSFEEAVYRRREAERCLYKEFSPNA